MHWPSGMVGALDLVFVMALFALGLRLRATGRKAVGSVRAGPQVGGVARSWHAGDRADSD